MLAPMSARPEPRAEGRDARSTRSGRRVAAIATATTHMEVAREATRGQSPEAGLVLDTAMKKPPKPMPAIAPWRKAERTCLRSPPPGPPQERRRMAGTQAVAPARVRGESRSPRAIPKAAGRRADTRAETGETTATMLVAMPR